MFGLGKFCFEKTAQIMIVNSFPPVPRMDHILYKCMIGPVPHSTTGMVHAESANNNEALSVGERVITARPYEEDSRPWRISSTVKREWKIQVRQASCYCSACRVHDFSACKVESVYPGLVGAVKREVVKEKASLTSVGAQTD